MQEDYQDSTLSLSQRAYLITKLLGNFGKHLRSILAFNSFFLALGWIVLYSHVNILDFILLELSFGTAVTTVSYLVTGRRAYREFREWNEDYLEQAYILVFDTTIPSGNTNGEKVLNLAKTIFPELRPDYVSKSDDYMDILKSYLKKKVLHKSLQQDIISKNINYKGKPYSFDIILKTTEGYFIVKDFDDKVVTLEDLKELVQLIRVRFKDKYQRTNVFRVICVGKQYDQSFLQPKSLEQQMIKELGANFNIDLLIEENVGYSVLWIDH